MDTENLHATALDVVHTEAGRTLSKADFDLCMRVAKRALSAALAPAAAQAPVAWVRYRSDGGFEGPIMDIDVRMDGVRRTCGAWTPLYAAPVAPAAAQVPVEGSPAFALRGLYKSATEYFVDGKPVTPDEYIAWQAQIIESVTRAKLPDPKYYGGSSEEDDLHEVKCAYVDGWNDCRSSILAAPVAPEAGAPINLEGLRKKLLTPRKILRDECGWLTHPDYPICDEGTCADKFLEAFGIETRFRSMESDLPDLHERWCDEGLDDCSEWTPTPPEGDGWLLLEIYDTEDGPYALFGRDRYEAENALKRMRTRELSARIQKRQAPQGDQQ